MAAEDTGTRSATRVAGKLSVTMLVFSCFLLVMTGVCTDAKSVVRGARRRLLLISFDGFRWDYYGRYPTPNLDEMRRSGVHARIGLRPAFTTKTFPNHYTLATGLYEESHGIIDNDMYDPVFKEYFTQTTTDPKWWEAGEPLWITATRQGLKSGVYFWPGSAVVFRNNLRPQLYAPYDKSVQFRSRADKVLEWLVKDKADLVMAYFHEPDESGHEAGAFSGAVAHAVAEVDQTLGYMVDKLNRSRILEDTNIIVLSDHGIANRSSKGDYLIDLSTIPGLLDRVDKVVPASGPVVGVQPKTEADREWVVRTLKDARKKMTVYKKEEIPDSYHYKNNRRVMSVVLVADEGYVITRTPQDTWEMVGWHGYNNQLSSMRPIFFARGPDFKSGFEFDGTVENVNVYPLACYLLGIEPAPNNGTLRAMADTLTLNGAQATPPSYYVYLLSTTLILQNLKNF